VDLVLAFAVVARPGLVVGVVEFADADAVARVAVEQGPERPVQLVHVRVPVVVAMEIADPAAEATELVGARRRGLRVVAQIRILHDHRRHVDPEAVDAPIEPEAGHIEHRASDRWIAPVQIGLLGQEAVEVVLAADVVEGPWRRTEHGQPAVGRRAVGLRVAPDEPIALPTVEGGS
jgi:hypothetical protein